MHTWTNNWISLTFFCSHRMWWDYRWIWCDNYGFFFIRLISQFSSYIFSFSIFLVCGVIRYWLCWKCVEILLLTLPIHVACQSEKHISKRKRSMNGELSNNQQSDEIGEWRARMNWIYVYRNRLHIQWRTLEMHDLDGSRCLRVSVRKRSTLCAHNKTLHVCVPCVLMCVDDCFCVSSEILSAQLSLSMTWHGVCLMNVPFIRTAKWQSIRINPFDLIGIRNITWLHAMSCEENKSNRKRILNFMWKNSIFFLLWFVHFTREMNTAPSTVARRHLNWENVLWLVDSSCQNTNKHTLTKYTCEFILSMEPNCWLLVWFQCMLILDKQIDI